MSTFERIGIPTRIEASDGSVTLSLPIKVKQRSGRKIITLPNDNGEDVRPLDSKPTALQAALARGHHWLAMLESGAASSIRDIANQTGTDHSYISRMINLTTLAPDIVAAILDDDVPSHLTQADLVIALPICWNKQRKKLGF